MKSLTGSARSPRAMYSGYRYFVYLCKVNYGVPEDVLAVLKLSYEKPTPVQMQTLPLMLDRRETLVCAPTGSGKKKNHLLVTLLCKNSMLNECSGKNIFQVITKFFEKHNFNILSYDFIAKKNRQTGVVNNVYLQQQYVQDIEQGVAIMRRISSDDIGQSLVIENGLVLGVECTEGTDELIKRGGKLQQLKKKAILIKVCKKQQDERVDLPCIGPETIKNIAKVDYAGIVFETKKTVILQFDECRRIADENEIFIYGI